MNKGSVIVVDDDRSLRQFLTILFRRNGYSVRAAGGGGEALGFMNDAPADVVVTDLNMETMDGMEVLRRVKQGWPDTDVKGEGRYPNDVLVSGFDILFFQ